MITHHTFEKVFICFKVDSKSRRFSKKCNDQSKAIVDIVHDKCDGQTNHCKNMSCNEECYNVPQGPNQLKILMVLPNTCIV